MNALIECRGGLHRHSGPGRLRDRERARAGLHLGSGDRQVVLGPEIPAVADLDRRHRRSHDHAGRGQGALNGRVVSRELLISIRNPFTVPMYGCR